MLCNANAIIYLRVNELSLIDNVTLACQRPSHLPENINAI